MSSAKENTVRSSKKVPCYCPRCNGKTVDPRTKCDHINLADIGSTSISEEQLSSKRKHNEEPLPELTKHSNSESEDSDDEDSNRKYSDSNRIESNRSESEEKSTTNKEDSTTNEEDSTSSNENSIELSTNSINTFLEDDFEEQSLIIERSAKDKFKQPSLVY